MSLWRTVQGFFSSSAIPQTKQEVGQEGERRAAQYLQSHGMRILHHNWRCGSLELDLVGEDAEGIVFVEVKTRKANNMTSPLEGITHKKRATLLKAAQAWLAAHEAEGVYDKPCRFAVVAVEYELNENSMTYKVALYDHAFDYTHTY